MSANETKLKVEQIRSQYEVKLPTDLDRLKALDAKVKRGANIFGYTYGTLSALIMGTGMSLVLTELGNAFDGLRAIGVAVGIIGLIMALTTAPIYNKILARRKKAYAAQILELSEKILNG